MQHKSVSHIQWQKNCEMLKRSYFFHLPFIPIEGENTMWTSNSALSLKELLFYKEKKTLNLQASDFGHALWGRKDEY